MRLPANTVKELESADLSVNDRARLRCRLAQRYEQAGDYEAAREALGEFWQGIGVRPDLEGLHDANKAALLSRVGALTGWLGSLRQVEGAQEAAKDLISESLGVFQLRGLKSK